MVSDAGIISNTLHGKFGTDSSITYGTLEVRDVPSKLSDGAGHAETTGIGSGGANVTWTGSTWAVSGGKASCGPGLGGEIYKPDASIFTSGTYSWTKAGNNTVENDSNTLKITYVDDTSGAYSGYWRNENDRKEIADRQNLI